MDYNNLPGGSGYFVARRRDSRFRGAGTGTRDTSFVLQEGNLTPSGQGIDELDFLSLGAGESALSGPGKKRMKRH